MQKVLLLFSLFSMLTYIGPSLSIPFSTVASLHADAALPVESLHLIANDITSCEGSTISLQSLVLGGTTPYSYNWTGPNSFSSVLAAPRIENIQTTDIGIYQLVVTDATGTQDSIEIFLDTPLACSDYLEVNDKQALPKYVIDFETAPPTFNWLSLQKLELVGDVLLNDNKGTDAGFDYIINIEVEGGPDGTSAISFPTNHLTAASRLEQENTKIGTSGGKAAFVYTLEGRAGNNTITYLRDLSTQMNFSLTLDTGADFANATYEVGDMDYNFESSTVTNTCYNQGEPNDYRCRYSYIDRITFLSGVADNQYTFPDASVIKQVNQAQFYANFTDTNNNNRPDISDDGRIPSFSPDGNIIVYNPKNIGNEIKFIYDDPGYGLEEDADGYHDFDSKNQIMSFLTGMTFDVAAECPLLTHYMLCNESTKLTADTTLTDVTWFNSANEIMGSGTTLVLDSSQVIGIDSFYYVGTNGQGCREKLCCPLPIMRCCLKVDLGDQNQSIDPNTAPNLLTANILSLQGGGSVVYQWQASTSSCEDLFIDIPGATSATYQPAELTQTTFYRVMVTESIGGEATCQAICSCIRIDVASMIGGCIVEDTNRDGLLNDGNTPIAGIPIYIYLSTDLNNPIDSIVTDENGKYQFDSLYADTYVMGYELPSNYKLPELTPFGELRNTNGFTKKIFVPSGLIDLTYNLSLVPCIDVSINLRDTTIVLGDTLTAIVTGPGNYTWSQMNGLDCATCDIVQLFPDTTTTYQVTSGEECVCEGPTVTITVLNELGGCVREDINGDGIPNDGATPMEDIVVNLYLEGDTINPIATTTTSADGKYNFDSLSTGKYLVAFIPAVNYDFPMTALPVGNLSDRLGFSEVICLESGDEKLDNDAVLGTCPTFELPFNEITIVAGDTVCVKIDQGGTYVWTPTNDIDCTTCQEVKLTPDSTTTYYVDRGVVNAYNCPHSDSVKVIVLGSINGCIAADGDRNGIADDSTPLQDIVVKLYDATDTINPIEILFTDEAGKYTFDSLPDGKYYVEIELPDGSIFPIGDYADKKGFTELICLESGDETIIPVVPVADCHPIELSEIERTIIAGDSVCISILKAGDYIWTPTTGISCDTCQHICVTPDSTTTYTVGWTNPDIYDCPHEATITVTVLSEIGGCVREDVNKDGIANDGNTAMDDIVVNLYEVGDTINPIETALTDADGKYKFDSLPAGKYYVNFEPRVDYSFAPNFTPIGNMIVRDGYSDIICLESGDSQLDKDALLEKCYTSELSITEARVFSGQEVVVTVDGGGYYEWTPTIAGYENCDTCTVFKIIADSSAVYTVTSNAANACATDEAELTIRTAFIDLSDPCDCLGNKKFGELIAIYSFEDDEIWTLVGGHGLYDRSTGEDTLVYGVVMDYIGISDNGFHTYTLPAIHYDAIGYEGVFSNGIQTLDIHNLCYEKDLCQDLPIASLGGCVREDLNRDALANDGATPMTNITVNLYEQGDTINSIATQTTNEEGKYLFEELKDGKYFVEFEAPTDYLFPLTSLSVGNLTDRIGYTDTLCLEIGEDKRDVDALLSKCYEIDLSVREIEIVVGETVTVTVTEAGDYSWSPTAGIDCTDCQTVNLTPDTTTTYIVNWNNQDTYACGHENEITIKVLSSLGGCVREDLNRDGIVNDGNTPMDNITVNLYTEKDSINPIATALTNELGKYRFDSLPAGKYYVNFEEPIDYNFAPDFMPIGDMIARLGYSDIICLESGDEQLDKDALLEKCYTTELSITEARVFTGQKVTVSVSGGGFYEWTPTIPGYENCDTCTVFTITADSSNVYTVRSQDENACVGDEATLTITTAFINIADPCDCLGNKKFGELISISSFAAGETWEYFEGDGLFDRNDASEIIPFGRTMDYVGLDEDGMHTYHFPAIHFDSIGYHAKFRNGDFELQIHNLCYETELCRGLPLAEIGGCVREDSNRDGLPNDGTTPMDNITVKLYEQGDTINPIATATTGTDGKYLFDELTEGKYFVEFEAAVDYNFPIEELPVGNLTDRNGFTDVICLDIGEEKTEVDGLLGQCHDIDLSLTAVSILPGETVTVSVNESGDYSWTPSTGINCTDCQTVQLNPTSTTTYTVNWANQAAYECQYPKTITVTVLECSITDIDVAIQTTDYPNNVLTATATAATNRTLTYQWQSSTTSCEEGFTDIREATAATHTPTEVTQATFFRVLITEEGEGKEICTLTSDCIGLGKIAGCVHEDINRDGVQDDEDAAMEGTFISLYDCDNLEITLATTSTDKDGKYCFTGLADGDYIVQIETPDAYIFPVKSSIDDAGYSSCIQIENGQEITDCSTLLGLCQDFETSLQAATILAGEEVCISIDEAGDYIWTPTIDLSCTDCNEICVQPTEATIYTAAWNNQEVYACPFSRQINVQFLTCSLENINVTIQAEETSHPALTATVDVANDRSLTYQWQSSTTSCDDGFSNIDGATAVNYTPSTLTQPTFFRVQITEHSDEEEICTLPSPCIGLGKIAGCLQEDNNRNGNKDSADTPMIGVSVGLYSCTNTEDALATTLTDEQGKYCFTGLTSGDYIVQIEAPEDYLFPLSSTINQEGYSSCINLGDGLEVEDCSTLLGSCHDFELSTLETAILAGEEVCVTTNKTGNYIWAPTEGVTCNGCEEVCFSPTATTTYTATWNNQEMYACPFNRQINIQLLTCSLENINVAVQSSNTAPSGNTAPPGNPIPSSSAINRELAATVDVGNDRSLTYQWQSSTTSCDDGFSNIDGATAVNYTPSALTQPTFFRVQITEHSGEKEICTLPSPCIGLGKIAGCLHEDTNRNGNQDSADTPMSDVAIGLYYCTNTEEAVATTLTDKEGKYCFTGLASGDYIVQIEAPEDYLFPIKSAVNQEGYSSCINLGDGFEVIDCGTLLGACHDFEPSIIEAAILAGEEVCVTTNKAGDYIWTPREGVTCNDCEKVCFSPTATTTYTAAWNNQDAYQCSFAKQLTINLLSCSLADMEVAIQSSTYPNHTLAATTTADADRTISYQWQISTASCDAGFTDIAGATAATYTTAAITQPTFFRVLLTEHGAGKEICTLPSTCISLGKIGGCVTEDTNRDNEANDGNIPLSGVPVLLYACDDLDTPISIITTDEAGKYCFVSVPTGDYRVEVDPSSGYKLPTTTNTDCIQIEAGEDYESCIGLHPCVPTELSITTATAIKGEEVCVTVSGVGEYIWTPSASITQNENIYKIKATESTTFTVRSEDYYSCGNTANLAVNVWEPQALIKDPCTCLGNGAFREEIQVLGVTATETWTLLSTDGLSNAIGTTLTYTGTHYSGLHIYTMPVQHSDGAGYTANFTNGTDVLEVRNSCFEDQSCNTTPIINDDPDATPGAPVETCTHIINVSETSPAIDSIHNCAAGCIFRSDGIDKFSLYTDTIARNNIHTICPQDQWHTVKITFDQFDIAPGDALVVFEGKDAFGPEIANWTGSGVSLTGGWIAANCDPSINLSGCLTFQFTTNGDNGKGLGWHSVATCEPRAAQLVCPDRNGLSVVGDADKTNRDLSSLNTSLGTCNGSIDVNIPLPEFVGCALNNPTALARPFFLEVLHDGLSLGKFENLGIAGATIPTVNNVRAGVHSVTYILHFDMDADGNPNDGQLVEKERISCSYLVNDATDLVGNDNIVVSLGDDCWTDIGLDDVLEGYENLVNGATLKSDYLLTIDGTTSNEGTYSNIDAEVVVSVGNTGTFEYKVQDACGNVVGGTITVVDYQGPVCTGPQIIHQLCAALPAPTAPPFKDCSGVAETSHDELSYGTCGIFSQVEVDALLSHFDVATFVAVTGGFTFTTTATNASVNTITIRSWKATDELGNLTENCPQIYINYRPTTVNMPDLAVLPVQCGEATTPTGIHALNRFTKQNIAPWYTVTLPNGSAITDFILPSEEHAVCNYLADYKDQVIETCGQGKKILRTWTLLDWCGANTTPSAPFTQIIKVEDTVEPILVSGPEATTHSTEHFDCSANVTLEAATWTDDCAEVVTYRTEIRERIDPDGDGNFEEHLATTPVLWSNNENGGTFNTIEPGTYWVFYYGIDECGNETSQLVAGQNQVDWSDIPANIHVTTLTVVDDIKPQAQCDNHINTSLGVDWGQISAKDVDEGSFDNCGIATIEISRTGAAGSFAPTVNISCEDVHNELKVYLRVVDKAGNDNHCSSTLTIEDKIPPYCGELDNQTATCKETHLDALGFNTDFNSNNKMDDAEWADLSGERLAYWNTQYGDPATVCSDNASACHVLTYEQQFQLVPQECGAATAKRRYRAIDWNGEGKKSAWVEQTITITYEADWKITLPADWVGTCGDQIPTETITIENGTCDALSYEVSEQTFTTVEGACVKVVRTYTITNACLYEVGQRPIVIERSEINGQANTGLIVRASDGSDLANAGLIQYIQVLELQDREAPIVAAGNVVTCLTECTEERVFSVAGIDCNLASTEALRYSWAIFENGIQTGDGLGNTFAWNVQAKTPSGISYQVVWTVIDPCGNSVKEKTIYNFEDCKPPTAYCLHGLSIALMSTGMVDVWTSDLDLNSFDNCTPTDKLDFRLRQDGQATPTTVDEVLALDNNLIFTCNQLGTQLVDLYIIDQAGNYDFCTTYINVQDNNGACQGAVSEEQEMATVAGRIKDWKNQAISSVNIATENAAQKMGDNTTQTDGIYEFNLPMYDSYTITPTKDIHPLNGVSTYDLVLITKHILGIQPFQNPYQWIAADVNRSQTITAFDMVQLRRLILNMDKNFQNNTSWRFVEAAHEWTADNPLTIALPEVSTITDLHQNMEMDFVAIKTGDVNGTARPNNLAIADTRTSEVFEIEVANRPIKAGETYAVDFTTSQISNVAGYQFTLNYEGLELAQVVGNLMTMEHFGLQKMEEGYITASWNQTANSMATTPTTTLFTLHFQARQDGQLKDLLGLQSHPTIAEAYKADGSELAIAFNFAEADHTKSFELYQNEPNPFHDQTTIGFYLPGDSEVELILRDETGRTIKTIQEVRVAGNNELQLDATALPKGFLYYELRTRFGKKTKKMILVK